MVLKDLVVRGPMPKAKRKREPSIAPIHVNKETWFYPDRKGLLVVHEIRDRDAYVRTDQFTIKWVDVKTALALHDLHKKQGYT